MKEDYKAKLVLVVMCVLLLAIALSLSSCSKSAEHNSEQKAAVEETGKAHPETNLTAEEQPEASTPAEEQEEVAETPSAEEETSSEETIPSSNETAARPSEVEFYLLFKRSTFVKRTIAEEQSRTYGMEGNESTAASEGFTITVTPLIITQDSVKFKINNYTTKALKEHESDGTAEFDIFVNNIYYRP